MPKILNSSLTLQTSNPLPHLDHKCLKYHSTCSGSSHSVAFHPTLSKIHNRLAGDDNQHAAILYSVTSTTSPRTTFTLSSIIKLHWAGCEHAKYQDSKCCNMHTFLKRERENTRKQISTLMYNLEVSKLKKITKIRQKKHLHNDNAKHFSLV